MHNYDFKCEISGVHMLCVFVSVFVLLTLKAGVVTYLHFIHVRTWSRVFNTLRPPFTILTC